MCGIAAIFNYRTGEAVDRAELIRIRDAMALRGPDGFGDWFSVDGRVGLGHRRLSIQDLSAAGAQPMHSADGKLVVTFNGEIYNYPELRAELQQKGCHFRSTCDTEVLLHLYASEGEAMVHKLRGMYAFALWDEAKKGLLLARDPYGIKPLYYSDDGKTLRLASQVKALLAGGRIDTSPEPAGHVGFFLWGYVPSPYTLYRGIRSLPAGATLWIDQDGNHRQDTFCSIRAVLAEAEDMSKEPGAGSGERGHAPCSPLPALRSTLLDSVRHHLIADVPVGVFLSSGTDSTSVASLAAEYGTTLRTVTLGFKEFKGTDNDETPLAAAVARHLGANHQTVWVTRGDFLQYRDRLFASMDQPTIDGVNTFFVSLAAELSSLKVALSGLGGDELFGGYPSFEGIPRAVHALGAFSQWPRFGKGARVLSAPVLRRMTSPKYASLFEYGGTYAGAYLLRRSLFMPWELPEFLDGDLIRQGWEQLRPVTELEETLGPLKSARAKITCLESSWYMRNQLLRDSDWAGMAHSLEIRVPLVDIQLLRELAPLLGGQHPPSKRDLALASLPSASTSRGPSAAGTSPSPLAALAYRPKTGFSIPVRQWLLEGLENSHGAAPSTASASPGKHSALQYDRGLRGWAKIVYHQFTNGELMRNGRGAVRPAARNQTQKISGVNRRKAAPTAAKRFLVLVGDAFGGFGGMAKFNRDLLTALCHFPDAGEVVALPRIISQPVTALPARLRYVSQAANNKLRYTWQVLREAAFRPRPDLVICGHIHFLPFAFVYRFLYDVPVVLVLHGIEAWKPHKGFLVNPLARRINRFVAVSEVTKARFLDWASASGKTGLILPNCVDLSRFSPGPKDPALLLRYGLQDKTVIMTLGRLASEERYKGFDEILEVLPDLARQIPNLAYLIVGDGPDRPRLEEKVRHLRLESRVVFAGRIPEEEKADHYRLADAYVMPSRGEGFGIVYLEAMACGIPVVASKADGSREAVRNGALGILVDPGNAAEIKEGILRALAANGHPLGRAVPAGLDYFSYPNFERRCHRILRLTLDEGRGAGSGENAEGREKREEGREETRLEDTTALLQTPTASLIPAQGNALGLSANNHYQR